MRTKELAKLFKTFNVWPFFGYNKMHSQIIAMAASYRNKTRVYASVHCIQSFDHSSAERNGIAQKKIIRDLLSFRSVSRAVSECSGKEAKITTTTQINIKFNNVGNHIR